MKTTEIESNVPDLKIDFNEPFLLELYSGDRRISNKICIPGNQLKIYHTDKDMKIVLKCIDISMKL